MPWRQYVKSRIANATRQAHCQAHKTYSTEANLPMSLPACSAWVTVFRWTELNCKTLLMDRGKGERTTGGLPKYGRTEVIFGICNSIVLHIGLDIYYLAFCCYLHHQFFQSSSVPGRRNTNSRTSASPFRWLPYPNIICFAGV
jgi:hypothetical protein